MVAAWRAYQAQVGEFFRHIGLAAEMDVEIQGARTKHDIDVYVTSRHAGFDLVWLVECKSWQRRVPKERVFTLRSIVDDTGADRGFMMAESGYQKGALEAALLTNVHLASLAELVETHAYDLGMTQLRSLGPRIDRCNERYWSIGKGDRIDHDLRPDYSGGFSGTHVINAANHSLNMAFREGFPVSYDRLYGAMAATFGRRTLLDEVPAPEARAKTPSELFSIIDAELAELERRLDSAEDALTRRRRT